MTRASLWMSAAALVVGCASLTGCDNGPTVTTDPVAPVLPSTPITETFSSQLSVGGSSLRSFTTQLSGSATVTLVSAGPPSNVSLGFGIGVPDATTAACYLARSVVAPAGATFTMAVDRDTYCVKVYDPGTLTAATTFSVKIVRP